MKMIVALAGLTIATGAQAQETRPLPRDLTGSYICNVTESGGIRFDRESGKWRSARFNTDGKSFSVRVNATGETGKSAFLDTPFRYYRVNVEQFGEKSRDTECSGYFNSTDTEGRISVSGAAIRCQQWPDRFWFNFDLNRFQMTHEGGYMSENDTTTPYVAVGVCAKVN